MYKLIPKDSNPHFKCRKCGKRNIEFKEDDGIYEDIHYHCLDCGYSWWIEGSDY